jgi:hypothetical protein
MDSVRPNADSFHGVPHVGHVIQVQFRMLPTPALLLPLLLSTVASADRGGENWGEVRCAAPQIALPPVEGIISLAVFLLERPRGKSEC